MKESIIVKQILQVLAMMNCTAGKVKTMGVMRGGRFCYDRFVFRGFPDVCAFDGQTGKMFFIEAKSEVGRQSEEQKDFQDLCIRAGITYVICRSADDAVQALENIRLDNLRREK